jgi:hypothetical protein
MVERVKDVHIFFDIRGVFTKNSYWQAKQSIPHTTVSCRSRGLKNKPRKNPREGDSMLTTSVEFQQATWRCNLEDRNVHNPVWEPHILTIIFPVCKVWNLTFAEGHKLLFSFTFVCRPLIKLLLRRYSP